MPKQKRKSSKPWYKVMWQNPWNGFIWKIICISLLTIGFEFIAFLLLKASGYLAHFDKIDKINIAHLVFLVAFWLTYLLGEQFKIGRLRSYLDRYTYRTDIIDKDTSDQEIEDRAKAIASKITTSITSQGIFIAIVSLILNLLYRIPSQGQTISEYQSFVKDVSIVIGFLAIIFMLWSIELLDTSQNAYKKNENNGEKQPLERVIYFYRKLGLGGGSSYRFYGFALLSIFLICSFSFLIPYLTSPLVVLFTYLGYPIIFGYEFVYEEQNKQNHEVHAFIPFKTLTVLFFLALFALYIWFRYN